MTCPLRLRVGSGAEAKQCHDSRLPQASSELPGSSSGRSSSVHGTVQNLRDESVFSRYDGISSLGPSSRHRAELLSCKLHAWGMG